MHRQWGEGIAPWAESTFRVCVKPWLISPLPHQRGMDVHRYHPGIKEMEPGEPEVQGPPQLRVS